MAVRVRALPQRRHSPAADDPGHAHVPRCVRSCRVRRGVAAMSTWEELERRFMQLAPEAHGMELHFQTGEDLRYWLSDGGQQARARFEVLAKEAGLKVL